MVKYNENYFLCNLVVLHSCYHSISTLIINNHEETCYVTEEIIQGWRSSNFQKLYTMISSPIIGSLVGITRSVDIYKFTYQLIISALVLTWWFSVHRCVIVISHYVLLLYYRSISHAEKAMNIDTHFNLHFRIVTIVLGTNILNSETPFKTKDFNYCLKKKNNKNIQIDKVRKIHNLKVFVLNSNSIRSTLFRNFLLS